MLLIMLIRHYEERDGYSRIVDSFIRRAIAWRENMLYIIKWRKVWGREEWSEGDVSSCRDDVSEASEA